MNQQPFSILEGVFNNFAEADGDLDVFQDKIWLDKQKAKIAQQLALLEPISKQKSLCNTGISKDYPLAIVATMLLAQYATITILDFGGSMGLQYLELIAKIPKATDNIYFHVVDNSSIINNIPHAIKQFTNLSFSENLPNLTRQIDIVHIGSSLQYIDDWQGLLQQLITLYQPKYLVLSDLLAGDIPTFVSCQLYYGKRIPIHMYNIMDVFNCIESFGLKNIYHTLYEVEILGEKKLANVNLPEKYRLSNTVNLIFVAKNIYDNK